MKTELTKEVTHTRILKNKPGWSHLAANPVTPTIVSAVSNVVPGTQPSYPNGIRLKILTMSSGQ